MLPVLVLVLMRLRLCQKLLLQRAVRALCVCECACVCECVCVRACLGGNPSTTPSRRVCFWGELIMWLVLRLDGSVSEILGVLFCSGRDV